LKANILTFNTHFDYVISTDISQSNNGLLYFIDLQEMHNKYKQWQEISRLRMNLLFMWSQGIAIGVSCGQRPRQLGNVATVPGGMRFFSFSKREFGFLGLTEHPVS
jgi:hypothetical protein